VVVVGSGRTGLQTARLLDDRGHDVVVEREPEVVAALSDEYVETVIEGDATRPSVLSQAGLDRADVVAALTGDTETNLAICLTVERTAPDLQTVMRTAREVGEEYSAFVDRVVFTEAAGARVAANAIERDVQTLADVTGSLDIMELTVAEGAPVAGRSPTSRSHRGVWSFGRGREPHRGVGDDARTRSHVRRRGRTGRERRGVEPHARGARDR
jgi:trk system potassium uptake protein TrkA